VNEQYVELLQEIGQRMGFDSLVPNKEGAVVLEFEETYVGIRFEEKSAMVNLYAFVTELPEECPKEVYEMMLESQLFFQQTHGATLSISKATHQALVHLNLYLEVLTAEKFTNAVQNLLDVAHETKERIETILGTASRPSVESNEDMHIMMESIQI